MTLLPCATTATPQALPMQGRGSCTREHSKGRVDTSQQGPAGSHEALGTKASSRSRVPWEQAAACFGDPAVPQSSWQCPVPCPWCGGLALALAARMCQHGGAAGTRLQEMNLLPCRGCSSADSRGTGGPARAWHGGTGVTRRAGGAGGAWGPGTVRGRFHLSPRRSRRQQPSRKRPGRGSRGRRRGQWGAGEGEAREGMGLAARQRRHPAAAMQPRTQHRLHSCPMSPELGQQHHRDAAGTSLWVQHEDPMALGHAVSQGCGAPRLWCPMALVPHGSGRGPQSSSLCANQPRLACSPCAHCCPSHLPALGACGMHGSHV